MTYRVTKKFFDLGEIAPGGFSNSTTLVGLASGASLNWGLYSAELNVFASNVTFSDSPSFFDLTINGFQYYEIQTFSAATSGGGPDFDLCAQGEFYPFYNTKQTLVRLTGPHFPEILPKWGGAAPEFTFKLRNNGSHSIRAELVLELGEE